MLKLFSYLAAFSFFFICACSSTEKEEKRIAKAGRFYGGNVSYFSRERTNNLFPLSAKSMYDQRAVAPVFETLLSFNDEDDFLSALNQFGNDADGNDIELEYVFTKDELHELFSPY